MTPRAGRDAGPNAASAAPGGRAILPPAAMRPHRALEMVHGDAAETCRGPMPYRALLLAEETWIAARALGAWLDAGHEVAEAWCPARSSLARPVRQPLALAFGDWSVRRILRRRGIPLRRCPPLRTWPDATDRAAATGADVLLNLLGLQIIPTALLARFPGRALNVHPAILPRYRGPSPRLAMLADGRSDEAGGVCLHLLTAGIDEGPIVADRRVPFPAAGGYTEWDARLADAAAALITDAALPYLDGRIAAVPQDESLACSARPATGELEIGPATTLARAHRLADTLGRVGRLVCKPPAGTTGRAAYHVTGVARVLGGPTGGPPVVGWRSLDVDIADARIRLVRRGLGDRARERAAAAAALWRRRDRLPVAAS